MRSDACSFLVQQSEKSMPRLSQWLEEDVPAEKSQDWECGKVYLPRFQKAMRTGALAAATKMNLQQRACFILPPLIYRNISFLMDALK